eukprot:9483038-Pyramimonas_sp.AAC.1
MHVVDLPAGDGLHDILVDAPAPGVLGRDSRDELCGVWDRVRVRPQVLEEQRPMLIASPGRRRWLPRRTPRPRPALPVIAEVQLPIAGAHNLAKPLLLVLGQPLQPLGGHVHGEVDLAVRPARGWVARARGPRSRPRAATHPALRLRWVGLDALLLLVRRRVRLLIWAVIEIADFSRFLLGHPHRLVQLEILEVVAALGAAWGAVRRLVAGGSTGIDARRWQQRGGRAGGVGGRPRRGGGRPRQRLHRTG